MRHVKPTFSYWPNPHSLTHQQVYYKWLERSWRAGLRIHTSLLTENHVLCTVYPLKKNSCDDRDAVRLQAKGMRAMQDYIDAQHGGPGRGWYRIVTDPFRARRVINQGKLAVVMGIETSIPFKCTIKLDVPQCDEDSIDESLAEVHKMGVRQMELVNKFDNALSGVAGDAAQTGVLVNGANFMETGSFWAMEHCQPEAEGVHDREQYAAPEIDRQQQDALFGAIYQVFGPKRVAPVYDSGPHCNQRGLTDLGKHLIKRMAERGMVFDPDHMSVAGRQAALDLLDRLPTSQRAARMAEDRALSLTVRALLPELQDDLARLLAGRAAEQGAGERFRVEARGDVSDHGPFALAGIPAAHLWTYEQPTLHTPQDTAASMSLASLQHHQIILCETGNSLTDRRKIIYQGYLY